MSQHELKSYIKGLVAAKVALTSQRHIYKNRILEAPLAPEDLLQRSLWFSRMDLKRGEWKSEIRHALLTYGFLRGVPYHKMEKKCTVAPDIYKIQGLVATFSRPVRSSLIEEWLSSYTERKKRAQEKMEVEAKRSQVREASQRRMEKVAELLG